MKTSIGSLSHQHRQLVVRDRVSQTKKSCKIALLQQQRSASFGQSTPVKSLICNKNKRMSAISRKTQSSQSQLMVVASASRGSSNLLVVGPGVLGSCLGKQWLDTHGAGTVVGQTKTTNNHDMLKKIGINPTTSSNDMGEKFANVAFCAPPSGSEDYPGDVAKALSMWDGTGNFIFTSSAGVYNVNDGSPCDESSPVFELGANPRTDALLLAEKACLDAGGCVVRLVGLYHRTRGPHTFFLKQGEIARWGGYVVNMIHYEDAAGLCDAVLRGQGSDDGLYRSEIFVGCDDCPITFDDMMASIEASGVLPGKAVFTEKDGGDNLGKKMSNERTRRQLQWTPRYSSVSSFFEGGGNDWYVENSTISGMPHSSS
jgi:hypothetical protein